MRAVCGQQFQRTPYERWAAQKRAADYRALGCFAFCCSFSDVVNALFAIIDEKVKEPPRQPRQEKAKAAAAAVSAASRATSSASSRSATSSLFALASPRMGSAGADPSFLRFDSAGVSSPAAAAAVYSAIAAAGGGSSPTHAAAMPPLRDAMPPVPPVASPHE